MTDEQYAGLPELAREIVDHDRQWRDVVTEKVVGIRAVDLIRHRKALSTAAARMFRRGGMVIDGGRPTAMAVAS